MVMARASLPVATLPPEVSRLRSTNKRLSEKRHLKVQREVLPWAFKNVVERNSVSGAIGAISGEVSRLQM